MARPLRVAVIGGGIGGLAAARALLMRGLEVTVFEQAPRLSEFGGGVVLTPNALTALRALGLEERVLAVAFESKSQVVRSWRSGRVIMRNSFASYRSMFGATSCSIHRGDMQKLLAEFDPSVTCGFPRAAPRSSPDRAARSRALPTAARSRPTWWSAPTAFIRPCAPACSVRKMRTSPA